METPAWIRELLDRIDAGDANKSSSFLAEDAVFQYGNANPVSGKAATRGAVAGFFAGIGSVRRHDLECWTALGACS